MPLATLLLTAGVLVPMPPAAARPFADLFAVPPVITNAPAANNGDYEGLDFASWIYVATAAGDWTVTAACGGNESRCRAEHTGGLFLWDIKHEAVAVPVGIAIDAAILVAVRELVGPDHPKIARGILYALSAARVVVLSHKISQLRRDPDRRN
jgi:hypothetical protein